MPVQFKATFEQLLLADITAGQVFGGDALAEKIAQYYNLTIQAGTPIGTAPGTGTFTTSKPREQLMANILKLYYKTAWFALLWYKKYILYRFRFSCEYEVVSNRYMHNHHGREIKNKNRSQEKQCIPKQYTSKEDTG